MARLVALGRRVIDALKAAGYPYVTVDLQGLRSGSMNETLAR
jgi:PP-loop superfamily ATP-utilizing enzyme